MATKEKVETIIEQNQWQIIINGYLGLFVRSGRKKGIKSPEYLVMKQSRQECR